MKMQATPPKLQTSNGKVIIAARNLVLVGILYILLATGTIFPVEYGNGFIYIHTILITIFILFLWMDRKTISLTAKSILILSPLFIIVFSSLLRTNTPELAYGKIEGGIVSTIICISIIIYISKYLNLFQFIKYFIIFSFMILIMTLLYRNVFGLESRDDRFFLNGPIVFGWIMGLNAILSFVLFQSAHKRIYLLTATIFVGATLLTGSKGPLVAVMLAVAVLALRWAHRPSTWLFMIFGGLSVFASASFVSLDNLERFQALERLVAGETSDSDYGSVGTRYDAWRDSINMFLEHPIFGVGLGNWNNFASNKIDYPHNFIMEILSEMGIFGIFSFSILLLYIIIKSDLLGRIILFYFMICMSFSGDLSYYRFMIALPLALILINHYSATKRYNSQ